MLVPVADIANHAQQPNCLFWLSEEDTAFQLLPIEVCLLAALCVAMCCFPRGRCCLRCAHCQARRGEPACLHRLLRHAGRGCHPCCWTCHSP